MVDYGSGGQGGIAWQGKLGVNYKPGAGEPALGYEYPGVTTAKHTIMALRNRLLGIFHLRYSWSVTC